jgi:hypothetical protein
MPWLYGEDPISTREMKEFAVKPTASPGSFGYHELRQEVLERLEDAHAHLMKMGRRDREIKVQIFSKNEWVEGDDAVHEMESKAGMARFAVEYPPYVFFDDSSAARLYRHSPGNQADRLLEIHRHRISTLHNTLREYGGKMILCKRSIERHLDPRLDNPVQFEDRVTLRTLLSNVKRFMDDHDQFHVGLADATPDLEFDIKSTTRAVIQGAGGYSYSDDASKKWGTLYIRIDDPARVLGLVIEFERAWDRINPNDRGNRDQGKVMAWLEGFAGDRSLWQ